MVSVAVVQYAFKAGAARLKEKIVASPQPTPPGHPLLLLQEGFMQPCSNQMREWCWLKTNKQKTPPKHKLCSLSNPNLISKPYHSHILSVVTSPPSCANGCAKNTHRGATSRLA